MSNVLDRRQQAKIGADPAESDVFRHGAILAAKVLGGAVAGAVIVTAGANVVHAENTADAVDTVDTPSRLYMEPGDTVWDDMLRQGYIPVEVIKDSENHGLKTEAEMNNPGLMVGDIWDVTPEVQKMKEDRIGGGLTVTLEKDQSIWGQATQAGVEKAKISKLIEWLDKNNGDEPLDVNNLPVGYTFIIPGWLLNKQTAPAIITQVQEPTIITIEAGSTIIGGLKKAGVSNVMAVKDEVLKANKLDEEDARHIMPGKQIIVPAGIISDSTTENAVNTPDAVVPAVEPVLPVQEAISAESNPEPNVAEQLTQPEVVSPVTLEEILAEEMRPNYKNNKVETAKLVEFIQNTFKHPAIDPKNGITEENVHLLFVLPERQEGFKFVVSPDTCAKEAIFSAPMLAFIIVNQDFSHWLTETDVNFSKFKDAFDWSLGDGNSGVHKKHQLGLAVDVRSIFDGYTNIANPDGPLFMPGRDGFNLLFTEYEIKFMQNTTLNGEKMADQVITSLKQMEIDITGVDKKGDFVAFDSTGMHLDHLHVELEDKYAVPGFNSKALPLSCDDPVTGGHTDFEQPVQVEEVAPSIESPAPPAEATPAEPAPTEPATATDTAEPNPVNVEPTNQEKNISIDSLLSDSAKNYQVVDSMTAYVKSKNSTNNGGSLSFDNAYGPTINASDVYIYLREAGASHEEALLLTAISSRETSLRPASVGDVNHVTNGQITASYGLFQIMALGGDDRDPSANLNPRLAAKNALSLARESGFGPWESFMPSDFTDESLADAIDLSHRKKPVPKDRAAEIAKNVLSQVNAIRQQVDAILG